MSDILISHTIKDVDVPRATAGFLREHPMPQIEDPEDLGQNPPIIIDQYTLRQWFIKVIFGYGNREIQNGLKKLAADATNYVNIFE